MAGSPASFCQPFFSVTCRPSPPADVELPDLAGAERALLHEVLARVDRQAVRRPRRAVDEPAVLLRDLRRLAAIGVHHPDVPQAVAIAAERDALAVRTEARLHVERRAARDARGQARSRSLDRHRVEVAEQVEHDRPPVGADVHVHPRAFVGLEVDDLRRSERRGDVPGRFLLRVSRRRLRGGGRRGCWAESAMPSDEQRGEGIESSVIVWAHRRVDAFRGARDSSGAQELSDAQRRVSARRRFVKRSRIVRDASTRFERAPHVPRADAAVRTPCLGVRGHLRRR